MRDQTIMTRENTVAKMYQLTRARVSLDLLTDGDMARVYVEARGDAVQELQTRIRWAAPTPTVRTCTVDGVSVVRVLGVPITSGDAPYVWGYVTIGRSQFSIASEDQLLAYLLSRYLPQE